MTNAAAFPAWACPHCSRPARSIDSSSDLDSVWRCPDCAREYICSDGIWDFLSPEQLTAYTPFLERYQAIRRAEGRARQDGDYYRALPFIDLPGSLGTQWKVRARNFEVLAAWLAAESNHALRIADLGAGCAWLSHRLTKLGHQLVAMDLLLEQEDGLGSARHYATRFPRARAEFNHIPLEPQSLDIVLYNGSIHYSNRFEDTLTEALRTLTPEGVIVVLDTPVFHKPTAGHLMMQEQERRSRTLLGTAPTPAPPPEGFLDPQRWTDLGHTLGLVWQRIDVRQGLRWELEPWRRRLRRMREPARFPILVARRIRP